MISQFIPIFKYINIFQEKKNKHFMVVASQMFEYAYMVCFVLKL